MLTQVLTPEQAVDKLQASVGLRSRYDNFIGGDWVPPVKGEYFSNASPITGRSICEVARSRAEDIEKALDAAHAASTGWARTSVAERALILHRIAARIDGNRDASPVAKTLDSGNRFR